MLSDAWANTEVSHGTGVTADLVGKFLDVLNLRGIDTSAWRPDYDAIMETADDCGYGYRVDNDADKETLIDILIKVMDALDAHAPSGYYFGATEGDGTCYGFWPVEESE